jgi:NAD(P)-dependent dehydrogenase (short-subunit alcohol dehydrogenase family)
MIERGIGEPELDNDHYHRFVAYGQSKTANILFALQLREGLAKDDIQSFAVHPGSSCCNQTIGECRNWI